MNVYDQWLSGYAFGSDPGHVGKPIVRMDHVKLVLPGYGGSYQGIAHDFFHQVFSVFTGKLVFLSE